MIRLDDLTVFVLAVDNGSLSAAARLFNIVPAAASAAIKRLERELGARLLARSTRSLRLTQEGERYLDYARRALEDLQAGKDSLAYGQKSVGGDFVLSVPSDLGRCVLAGWLDEFQTLHPALTLQVRIGDRLVDMFKQRVDAVVRYGIPDDSTLIALPLAPENRRVLCAAPAYFARHGAPKAPRDLRQHNCLLLSLSDTMHDHWTFGEGSGEQVVRVNGNRSSDDGELVRRWAVSGQGIAYKSRLDVLADLRAGRLVPALQDWTTEHAPLHFISTQRVTQSPALGKLREYLHERIAAYLADDL